MYSFGAKDILLSQYFHVRRIHPLHHPNRFRTCSDDMTTLHSTLVFFLKYFLFSKVKYWQRAAYDDRLIAREKHIRRRRRRLSMAGLTDNNQLKAAEEEMPKAAEEEMARMTTTTGKDGNDNGRGRQRRQGRRQ